MGRWTAHIIGLGLCFLIVFPPLAFGSVYPWAYNILELVCFSLVLVWLIATRLTHRDTQRSNWSLSSPMGLPFVLLLGLFVFQLIPMPPVVLKTISPNTHALYRETLDGYGEAVQAKEPGERRDASRPDGEQGEDFSTWRTLSVYRHATKTELLKILAYVCAFLLVLVWVNQPVHLRRLLYLMVTLGGVLALIGMVQRFLGTDRIYGFWEPIFRKDGSFFGPFVNPNHFAGYMVLVIPISVTLFLREIERIGWRRSWELRDYLERLDDRNILGAVLILMAMVFMISALFASLSRGGIFAFAGSMVFLISALSFKGRWPRKLGLAVMAGLFVSLFVFWLGFIPFRAEMETLSRLLQDKSMHFRFDVWRDGWRMFADFPLFGTGLGTFAHLYPKYKTILGQATVLYPENDFFQFLIETGVVGASLLAWFFIAFFRVLRARWKDPNDIHGRINPKVMIGLVAALVAVMIHGFGDFNLHIPATALHFALVMGLAMTVKPSKNWTERSWA